MSISSREDANKYYQVVNKLVDEYMDKWKIRPTNLKRYLKNGSDKFEKFIERNGLKDINGIKQVINDVIDDRVHMESDGVLTFESFKVFESDEFKITSLVQCLYKGVGKTDIKAEKFLADHFDTNLSQIDIVDSDKHMFKISNWENEDVLAIVYNKDEFDIIRENIKEYLLDELLSKQVDLISGLSIKLEGLIDKEKFETQIESKLTDNVVTELINDSLTQNYTKFEFEKNENYYLWSYKKGE
jgi:hypothetical protein